MYKYISIADSQSIFNAHHPYGMDDDAALKKMRIEGDCMPPQSIVRKNEGGIFEENGFKLQGLFLVVRHGERGPMSHVKSGGDVSCSVASPGSLLPKYRTFLLNATASAPVGHYNRNGPFHNFPLLPPLSKSCLLGQMTFTGVAQMLQVGELLRQVYGNALGLLNKAVTIAKYSNATQPTYAADDVIIYSTRYRRSFQSV